MAEEYVVGIDLGMSYSCVGVCHKDNVIIIPNDYGYRITPSYVAFTDSEILVGDSAKIQSNSNCRNTVFDIHRLIGRDFYHQDIKNGKKYWPFNIIEKNKKPLIRVIYKGEIKDFTPEEILSFLLIKMKEIAEVHLCGYVKNVVIAVPTHFNISQYQAIKNAGLIAKLDIIRIVNSPTAAAINYVLKMKITEKKNIIVFDFGGGTCSASLLAFDKGIFEVKAVSGNNNLGGKDLDTRLVNHFVQEYSHSRSDLCRLRTKCERVKHILSNYDHVHIDSYLYDTIKVNFKKTKCSLCKPTDDTPFLQYSPLDRDEFEKLNDDLFNSAINLIKEVLNDANMITNQVHEIVLVGGSIRIPKIQKMIKELFKKKDDLILYINPDEAAAYGAAVQAAILSGNTSVKIKDILIQDVNVLPFNIETSGGVITPFIERNTVTPIKISKLFKLRTNKSHVENNPNYLDRIPKKNSVSIKIYEDEDKIYHYLILPILRNNTTIEVTFNLSLDFVLKISAADNHGNKNEITVNYGLSKKEIEYMAAEAENDRAENEIIAKKMQARINFESYVHNLKDKIKDDVVRSAIKWLDYNEEAEVQEYEDIQKLLEGHLIQFHE